MQSVLNASREIPGSEVFFIDSASTDQTVEIVKELGVTVYQFPPHWRRTPSAGRYIGYRYTSGKYVFFVDGDSVIEPDWIVKGIKFLDANPDYGGIAGVLNEAYVTPDEVMVGGVKNYFEQDLSKEVNPDTYLGGSAMYRREAIEQAGPFNPYLPTGEEAEICLRIRRKGWKVGRINSLMSTKHTEDRKTFKEIFRRMNTSFFDCGTSIRYAALYGGAIEYAMVSVPFVVSTIFGGIGLAIFFAIAIYFGFFTYSLLACLAGFALLCIKKRSIRHVVLALVFRLVCTYGTIRSYLSAKVQKIEDYPTDPVRLS
jgi:cellulose synthase/poly-beta-1,6-N-acetylglucosamine synthase-like glycosyltransferase